MIPTEPVDHIKSIYQELFTVKLLHNGYSKPNRSPIASALSIKPDKATLVLLKNQQMDYRFFTDTLICFIQCDLFAPPALKIKKPHIKPGANTMMRFLINASTDFIKKTNIDATGSKEVYQFNNKANVNSNKFISQHEGTVNNDDLKSIDLVKPDEPCFAVVDIYCSGTLAEYNLFNTNGTLITNETGPDGQNHFPAYNIRFTSKI